MAGSFNSISNKIQLVECPRDAMHGWKTFISANKKELIPLLCSLFLYSLPAHIHSASVDIYCT